MARSIGLMHGLIVRHIGGMSVWHMAFRRWRQERLLHILQGPETILLPLKIILLFCQGSHNKVPQAGWLFSNRLEHVFSPSWRRDVHDPGAGRPGSPEASPLGVSTAVCSLSPRVAVRAVCVCVPTSSSHKEPGPAGSGSTLVTSCYLHPHLLKGLQTRPHLEVPDVQPGLPS